MSVTHLNSTLLCTRPRKLNLDSSGPDETVSSTTITIRFAGADWLQLKLLVAKAQFPGYKRSKRSWTWPVVRAVLAKARTLNSLRMPKWSR